MHGLPSAGDYLVAIHGPQAANDARVHLDLIYRARDVADRILASADAVAGQGVDGGAPGDVMIALHADPTPVACGDQLVLRATITSASSPYLEFLVTMTLP